MVVHVKVQPAYAARVVNKGKVVIGSPGFHALIGIYGELFRGTRRVS